MKILLIWNYIVIKADHDLYCHNSVNKEEIYNEKYAILYTIHENQYKLLKWINNINGLHRLVPIIKPSIIYYDINYHGSGQCKPSEHGLSHMIQKTPDKIIELITDIELWSKRKNKTKMNDSIVLQNYLNEMNYFITMFYKSMKNKLPSDMINLILTYVYQ